MRVLIAEDEPVSRKILQSVLEKAEYEVICVTNGDEAWETLQESETPQIAVLDWMMPGLEGPDICRCVRERNDLPPTYILLLTGKNDNESIVEGLRTGADDYIFKPFDSEVLLARVAVGERVVTLQENLAKRVNELKVAFYQLDEQTRALKDSEAKRLQDQKIKALGQISAGIAREINTPIQYVGDNTRFVEEAFDSFDDVFRWYQRLLNENKQGVINEKTIKAVEAKVIERGIEFLQEEIPVAIQQSLEGVERVATIVQAMKEFSQPGTEDKIEADLRSLIESTVTISRNEWKYTAEVETDFDPDMPNVNCYPGDFNQAVLNMIVNATHAIEEAKAKTRSSQNGLIKITVRADDRWAEIKISDTGAGIPLDAQPHIFEQFYTTKQAGKSSGQGLSIAYNTIVEKHGGTVNFESEPGVGTTFTIRLPLEAELSSIRTGR